jgi:hypothetical protein
MHSCDNPRCVNPDHLRLGTQADNVADMEKKRRHVVGEFQKRKGVEHHMSAFKDQADIDLILATKGQTKALAERFGVTMGTIIRVRRRNGIANPNAREVPAQAAVARGYRPHPQHATGNARTRQEVRRREDDDFQHSQGFNARSLTEPTQRSTRPPSGGLFILERDLC